LYTLLLGLFNTAIPIALISWAELHIDSGLAGILNSTVPLFTMVLAHIFLHDERITWPKALGLAAGFVGVVLLLSRDVAAQSLIGSLSGQLAVILASILYACSNIFIRLKLRDQHPIHTAAISLTSAFVFMAALALIFEYPVRVPHLPMTWLACAWMGLVGLSLAYYAYFYLLRSWGATRSVLVTYVFPVTAVILGVVFLGERPAWYVFAGGALVVAGIALVNLKRE
jgi:drug/metabolite transporter (DMT)-like permease